MGRFLPSETFYSRMDWLVSQVKFAPPARDYEEVLVAGDADSRPKSSAGARHGLCTFHRRR